METVKTLVIPPVYYTSDLQIEIVFEREDAMMPMLGCT